MTDGGRERDKSVPVIRWDKWDNRDKFALSHPSPSADLETSARPPSGAEGAGQGDTPKGGIPLVLPHQPHPVFGGFAFGEPPAPGTVVVWQGQPYDFAGAEPYVRRDGEVSTLLSWTTRCADCAAPFVAKTPLTCTGPVRRCATCSKAGHRVVPLVTPAGRKRSPGIQRAIGFEPAAPQSISSRSAA